ncbi:MAG: hypothetical protein ED556_12350 [Winogradskyella sp.]|uniref:hypothetical protein n=1 Tax=Winogradskyella sp. TaxID=1883156 RepID=UPI000F3B6674|nr:hypothetical protein [Winogradskyella sp.]RNC84240.1 MAG: hypothetical protein ED556_12350 [Winogradskyella sp.]
MQKLTILVLLSFYFCGFSQKSTIKYNRPFVIFEGCDDAVDKEKCYTTKSSEFIFNQLSDSLKTKLIKKSKSDTITLSSRLYFDEKGYVLKDLSKLYSSVDSTTKDVNYLIKKFPQIKPVLDEFDRGVASNVTSFYGFKIDSSRTDLELIPDFEPTDVPFEFLGKLPVFEGCSEQLNDEDAFRCMNYKLMKYIQENFRGDLIASAAGLSPGVNSIFLFFKINTEGKIELNYVRAPDPMLEAEGIRLIAGMPDAKSPGMLNGKAVNIPFFLPIKFVVEGDNKSEKEKKKSKRRKRRKKS